MRFHNAHETDRVPTVAEAGGLYNGTIRSTTHHMRRENVEWRRSWSRLSTEKSHRMMAWMWDQAGVFAAEPPTPEVSQDGETEGSYYGAQQRAPGI
jgi:hypothetical protein